jgi:hypothetical protein
VFRTEPTIIAVIMVMTAMAATSATTTGTTDQPIYFTNVQKTDVQNASVTVIVEASFPNFGQHLTSSHFRNAAM